MPIRYFTTFIFILFLVSPVFVGVAGAADQHLIGNEGRVSDQHLIGNEGRERGSGTTLTNPLKGDGTLKSLLKNILAFVVKIGAIVVVLMVVFVGFKFVMAQGVATEITAARDMFLWTVVGAIILLGAQLIADSIQLTTEALLK